MNEKFTIELTPLEAMMLTGSLKVAILMIDNSDFATTVLRKINSQIYSQTTDKHAIDAELDLQIKKATGEII